MKAIAESDMENVKGRFSGIELLKIFAAFRIVLSHMVQTLVSENAYIGYQDYVFNLNQATTNLQQLALIIMRLGALGNDIFFVCSAWFLLESKKADKKKMWRMLLNIWCISVAGLAITYVLCLGNVDMKTIIKCLFPTTFSVNWYMTCYLIFYLIHPILNGILRQMSQKSLLKSVTFLSILYLGINTVYGGLFFSSDLVIWIVIYFLMAYMKLYLKDFASSTLANACLLAVGLLGHIAIVLLTNYLGLRIGFFSSKVLHWHTNANPFLILSALALLNLARKPNWRSSFVNYISKLSMLIYLIHENLVVNRYLRPYLMNYVYEHFGYEYIALWVLLLACLVFLLSVLASIFYKCTLQKLVNMLSEKTYPGICKLYQIYEDHVIKIS